MADAQAKALFQTSLPFPMATQRRQEQQTQPPHLSVWQLTPEEIKAATPEFAAKYSSIERAAAITRILLQHGCNPAAAASILEVWQPHELQSLPLEPQQVLGVTDPCGLPEQPKVENPPQSAASSSGDRDHRQI